MEVVGDVDHPAAASAEHLRGVLGRQDGLAPQHVDQPAPADHCALVGVRYRRSLGATPDPADLADVYAGNLVHHVNEAIDDADDGVHDGGRRVLDALPQLAPATGQVL